MISTTQIKQLRTNWLKAAEEMNFRIVSPCEIKIEGALTKTFAFLPDFGSPKGMIICLTCPPQFQTDKSIIEWANEKGYFYSFINIENYLIYDEQVYKESLTDWTI